MKSAMAVEGGAKCVKYLLFFFNFIFWLCGLALIVLGTIVQVSVLNTAIIKQYSGSPIVLIIVGVVIFFIAFFGCCGAWKENQCMVTSFAVIVSLIIIVEVGTAIAGYVLRGKMSDFLQERFKVMINNYNKTQVDRDSIDTVQMQFKCCGGNSSQDWVNFNPSHTTVPDSCCINVTQGCGVGAIQDAKKIYTDGCIPSIEKLIKDNILWIAVGALVVAFVQITGIVLACILRQAIRSGYEVM
ncbi:CD63 antigen [Pimephales promelas]|uniref:CD63 antigen n=1 Tax=Pimephales promelas TaxID=90988 RepID=UPI001955C960|nr:CD63 antigen [Pimephales promelas]KAG1961011.1 CD63 antigen isoform A [Pimephales promelas]